MDFASGASPKETARQAPAGLPCPAAETCGACRACWSPDVTIISYPLRKPGRQPRPILRED